MWWSLVKKILLIVSIILVSTLSFGISTVAAESTLGSDVPEVATALNNARRLVRDSNGRLYAAYFAGLLRSGVHIARSMDDGASWTSEWANMDSEGSYPSLAIDGQNNLHCVWSSITGEIHYKKYTYASGTWDAAPTVLFTVSGGYVNGFPAIAVDGSGNIHVVWEYYLPPCWAHYIYYTKYTSSWSAPVEISNGLTDYFSPSIAIDGNNHIYVVYRGGSIYMAKYTTSWVETQVSATGSEPCIAIDSNNNPHIVYIDSQRVSYRYYGGASWSSPVTLDDSLHICHAPSLSISGGDVHVLWHNNVVEHNVWHHSSTDGGATWPTVNRALLASGLHPSLRWSFYNNPNVFQATEIQAEWIYTALVGSYDVKYDGIIKRPVGGEIIPVNMLSLLAPMMILVLVALALSKAGAGGTRTTI